MLIGKIGVCKSVHMWVRSENENCSHMFWFGVKSVGKGGWVYVLHGFLQGFSVAITGFYVVEFCCL